jgi:hypothetical protein
MDIYRFILSLWIFLTEIKPPRTQMSLNTLFTMLSVALFTEIIMESRVNRLTSTNVRIAVVYAEQGWH